jgi:hypothetical protein
MASTDGNAGDLIAAFVANGKRSKMLFLSGVQGERASTASKPDAWS